MKCFLLSVFLLITFILSAQNEILKNNDEPIFTVVDEMPSFPGGEEAMTKFLLENIKYPELEREKHISGRCFLTFIIEKNGNINDIKILRGVANGAGCDTEAIRVVKLMPPWNPGKQKGTAVRVQYNLPISFSIQYPNPEIPEDTIYFNSYWEECLKENSEYYRIIRKHNDGFLVTNFYSGTNTLQMKAICKEIEPLPMKNGHCAYFFKTGKKSSEGNYSKDKMVGLWTLWEETNTDSSTVECFEDGTYKNIFLAKSRITINDLYNKFYKIDEPAVFKGGEEAMFKWVARRVEFRGFPLKEKQEGISGTCYPIFYVEKDGGISNINLLKGIPNGDGYNKLALEIIKEMPPWNPGMQFGRPVRVQFNLPIRFTLP